METRIMTAREGIEEAARLIGAGEVVAFPTETVYGLGANALDRAAVGKIFTAKGRPADDPLIVHIIDEVGAVARDVSPVAVRLMDAFWPGPLTLVLTKRDHISDAITAGLPTVAVRMPSHPVAQDLLRAAAVPIVAPSANLFAHISPTTAQHVMDDLGGRIALILDGGPTEVGIESTVVDLTGEVATVLRPGGVTVDALREVVGEVVLSAPGARSAASPGMMDKHYAPRTPLTVFEGPNEAVYAALREAADSDAQVGVVIAEEDVAALRDIKAEVVVLGSLDDLPQMAQRLYAALRRMDAMDLAAIYVRGLPEQGAGLALRDRLRRAGEVVVVG